MMERAKNILLRHAGIPLYAPVHRHKLRRWQARAFPFIDAAVRDARRHRTGPAILIGLHQHLGDVVMASAVIRALRRSHPDALLFFATQPRYRALVDHNPRLDRVIDCHCVGSLLALREHPAFDRRHLLILHGNRCDFCGAAYHDPYAPFVAQSIDARRWFLHGRHLVDLMFERLGLDAADQAPELHLPAAIVSAARARLRALVPLDGGPIVAMHTRTPLWPAKQWPVENFTALMKQIGADLGARMLVVGSEPVTDLPVGVINLTGQTSLLETAALLGEVDVFVGLDSGPSHLAGAVGTSSVIIFGPTAPALCRPLGPHVTTLWHGSHEDGLFAKGLRPGAGVNRDIAKVTVDEVVDAVRGILSGTARTRVRSDA